MNTIKLIAIAAVAAALQACGGGDSGSCTRDVSIVTVEEPSGAITEIRYTEGSDIAHMVDASHAYPGAKISLRHENEPC